MENVAKEIVAGINKTTNDYDAAEEVDRILKKYLVKRKSQKYERTNKSEINRNSNQDNS